MAIGLGKRYFVQVIKVCFGDIDTCMKFMEENKPSNNKSWFELRPIVKIKKNKQIVLDEYQCSLVKDSNY